MVKEKLIAVYGTLREEQPNYMNLNMFSGTLANFQFKTNIGNFKMYNLGFYPAVFEEKNEDNGIRVEVYRVTRKLFDNIDSMEKSAGFVQKEIEIEGKGQVHKCIMWIHPEKPNAPVIVNGDWVRR